jgi:hypothetical protein
MPNPALAQSAIQSGQRIRYSGPFTNTTYALSGKVTIDIVFEPQNRISGYINFTNDPGKQTLCGAGNFTGTRQDRTLLLSFVSNDPDPGCGFDRGWKFTASAVLSPDSKSLESGTYQVNRARGIFTADSAKQTRSATAPQNQQKISQLQYTSAEAVGLKCAQAADQKNLPPEREKEITLLCVYMFKNSLNVLQSGSPPLPRLDHLAPDAKLSKIVTDVLSKNETNEVFRKNLTFDLGEDKAYEVTSFALKMAAFVFLQEDQEVRLGR